MTLPTEEETKYKTEIYLQFCIYNKKMKLSSNYKTELIF